MNCTPVKPQRVVCWKRITVVILLVWNISGPAVVPVYAADESAISRIYGGIHPPGDDVPGRLMGYRIGHQAFQKAQTFYPSDNLN